MPARDNVLIPVICEVLEKRPGLGANKLLKAVRPLYYEKNGKNLYGRHFYKYLLLMKENGLVDYRGGVNKGEQVEVYLTDKGKEQCHNRSFELSHKLTAYSEGFPKELKALYAIILYFNHGLRYTVYTKDAAENILRSMGLSLSSLITRSPRSIVESDLEDIEQEIFKSPSEDVTLFKEVFIQSELHEKGAKQYIIFLRGITCEEILKNEDMKVFKYLRFTSEDIRRAIESE